MIYGRKHDILITMKHISGHHSYLIKNKAFRKTPHSKVFSHYNDIAWEPVYTIIELDIEDTCDEVIFLGGDIFNKITRNNDI